MLFGLISFTHADRRLKHAETALEAHIAGIAGGKVSNKGIEGFLYGGLANAVSYYQYHTVRWRASLRSAFSRRSFFDTKPCSRCWEPSGWGTEPVVRILQISKPHGEAEMSLVQLA